MDGNVLFQIFFNSCTISSVKRNHYEDLPMQYTVIFSAVKIENFIRKMLIFFLFLLKT